MLVKIQFQVHSVKWEMRDAIIKLLYTLGGRILLGKFNKYVVISQLSPVHMRIRSSHTEEGVEL